MSAAQEFFEALQVADFDEYRRLLDEAQQAELEERRRILNTDTEDVA